MRLDRFESVLIIIALLSLWPVLFGYQAAWYSVYLVVVLAAMVWVTVRRMTRIRAAADEAKRIRDQMDQNRRPPLLR